MDFIDGGGLAKLISLLLEPLGLDVAELVEGLVELAGESIAMSADGVEQALLAAEGFGDGESGVEVGDIGVDGAGRRFEVEDGGFESGDAFQAPGGVGELVDEDSFGGALGFVVFEESLDVAVVGGAVFRGQEGVDGGKSVAERVQRGVGFAFGCPGAGGILGIEAVDGVAFRSGLGVGGGAGVRVANFENWFGVHAPL